MNTIIKFSINTSNGICNVSCYETASEYLERNGIEFDKKRLKKFFDNVAPRKVFDGKTFHVKSYANICDL